MIHAPKHAMLIALTQGKLSVAGAHRAQTHLNRCEVCRKVHAGHTRYAVVTNAARDLDLPTIDYDRMALTLRQQARAQTVRSSRQMLYGALAIAATVALAVFGASRLVTRDADLNAGREPASPTSPTHASPADVSIEPTTPARSATTATATQPATMVGDEIAEGMLLQTNSGDLRLALWADTESVLRQSSLVRVVKLQGRQLQLLIERGAVTSMVAPLRADDRFEIAVNDLVVSVRGTRFVVERGGDGRAQVTLSEGVVVVMRGEQQLARLVAPAQWTEERGIAVGRRSGALGSLEPLDEGTVSERSPSQITKPPGATQARRIDATPTAVKHLFARAAPLLGKCHQESLRADPNTPSAALLVLTINDFGQPQTVDVRARSGAVPSMLADCIRGHVISWHFPLEQAGGVRLEIPLNFSVPR